MPRLLNRLWSHSWLHEYYGSKVDLMATVKNGDAFHWEYQPRNTEMLPELSWSLLPRHVAEVALIIRRSCSGYMKTTPEVVIAFRPKEQVAHVDVKMLSDDILPKDWELRAWRDVRKYLDDLTESLGPEWRKNLRKSAVMCLLDKRRGGNE